MNKSVVHVANATNMFHEPHDPSWFLTCDHMRAAYFKQAGSVPDVVRYFWTDENLNFVRSEIERLLTRETQMDVVITPDSGFYDVCRHLCGMCANVDDVQRGLDALNKAVVNDLVHVHLSSIKQRKLFFKLAIHGDRELFLPPPQMTNGRRRIIKPSTEAYMVQHNPNGRYNEEFKARLKNMRKSTQFPLFDVVLNNSQRTAC
jgi:hypothetical protein